MPVTFMYSTSRKRKYVKVYTHFIMAILSHAFTIIHTLPPSLYTLYDVVYDASAGGTWWEFGSGIPIPLILVNTRWNGFGTYRQDFFL